MTMIMFRSVGRVPWKGQELRSNDKHSKQDQETHSFQTLVGTLYRQDQGMNYGRQSARKKEVSTQTTLLVNESAKPVTKAHVQW
jgi:hypothetical protein